MRLSKLLALIPALGLCLSAHALDVKAFSLSQSGRFPYDAAPAGQAKTPAQEAVDYIYSIGGRHVNLIPEARIPTVNASVINPLTPPGAARAQERTRYMRLINYIKSKGMTVGIRPIILLERSSGTDGKNWHGNIKPADPAAWFDSLRAYLDIYVNIARVAKVQEFTVGAELYSMTVGLEDQWKEQPFGFPREWTLAIRDIKAKLGSSTRVMYDLNYTDQTSNDDGTGASGGEFERWRYRLVDLKPDPSKPRTMEARNAAAWEQLKTLWLEFDMVGIDMYRSLIGRNEEIPANYNALVAKLQDRASQYASDIDSKLFEIENAVGSPKRVIIKEVGFKSCTKCFIDTYAYDDPTLVPNVQHQAAAYEAFMNAFVKADWNWLAGIAWWDIGTDPARSGERDPGFSPRGKRLTESAIMNGWN